MTDERSYMVMGEDEHGDYDLFATDDAERAEARYERMMETHGDVSANWKRGVDD